MFCIDWSFIFESYFLKNVRFVLFLLSLSIFKCIPVVLESCCGYSSVDLKCKC